MRRGGMSDRKLKKLVKKCRAMALSKGKSKSFSSSSVGCSISPRFSMRRSHSTFSYDSDNSDDSCMSYASTPPDVPAGYLAVYVGRERRRFIIPTTYLGRPVFRPLLDQAAEEFGFDNKGALTIPCEVVLFKQVIRVLDLNDTATTFDDLQFRTSECGSEALHKGRHRSRIFSVLQRSLA